MGSILFKIFDIESDQKPCTDSGTALINLNRQISPYIYQVVRDELMKLDIDMFCDDLIKECMQYIGFFFYSLILCNLETIQVHNLLSQHYSTMGIARDMSCQYQIQYYDLLYRSTGKYSNDSFKTALDSISNNENKHLLILFQTNYNHVFAVYLHKPLQQNVQKGHLVLNNDGHTALFLLRSQFTKRNTEKQTCGESPRLIETTTNSHCLLSSDTRIEIFGISLYYDRIHRNNTHSFTVPPTLDIIGNELVGGHLVKTYTGPHYFNLQQVEIYQVL
eukprot:607175_1